MLNFSDVTREHVERAMDEYDQRGEDGFLSRHGFGKPREYVLWHNAKAYDAKAIIGVAFGFATGTPAKAAQFPDGREGAATVLQELGYEVFSTSASSKDLPEPTAGPWRDAPDIGIDVARKEWADAARAVLIETAGRYGAVVTYKQLGGLVRERTGIRTGQLMHYWIGEVLTRVARDCAEREEPILSSLCVNASGSVGNGYALAVSEIHGDAPDDHDDHAAEERLACHHHFGADIPDDGGSATLTPQVITLRDRLRKQRLAEKAVPLCPNCHMALPATGECDYCA
ncbi:hypothetical protein [Nocardioides pacificus]